MIPDTGSSHPSDDDLLLYLEGGADDVLRAHAAGHLPGCGECAGRTDWLRRRSAALDARLAELDAPPAGLLPRSFAEARRRRGARTLPLGWAAAVAVVLLSGTVLATPLRARVLEWAAARWEDAVALVDGGSRPEGAGRDAAREGAQAAGHTEYRFVPEGAEFRLELASTQREGVLVVETTGEAAAVLVVVEPGAEREPVWVLPDRVEIRNTPGSTASYRLTLPAAVRVLRVRMAGEGWSTVRTGEFRPGARHVLPLRGEP